MPTQYISQIKLPSGNTYVIKDTEARQLIAGGVHYRGITTTALEDGSTTNPIQIGGQSYTAQTGDLVIYQASNKPDREFIWNGSSWDEFGVGIGTLGALAFKNNASGNYTAPTGSGTVNVPTWENNNDDLMLVIENEDKEEFVQSVSATKNSTAISITATGGSVGSMTTVDTSKFTQAQLTTKNYGFSSSQDVLSSATYDAATETLTLGKVTAGTQDVLSNAEFQNGFAVNGSAPTFPTYSIPVDTVVVDVDDSDKAEALIDANLSTDDGSSTSKSVSVTTSISQGSDTEISVTVGTESGTVTVS